MTVGQLLRTEREERQISLGEVARRSFIQLRFLQAIDDDNLAEVPESHIRLFVREYAKIVGLNPESALSLIAGYVPPPVVVGNDVDGSAFASTNGPTVATRTYSSEQSSYVGGSVTGEDVQRSRRNLLKDQSAGFSDMMSNAKTALTHGGIVNWLVGGGVILLIAVGIYYLVFREPSHKPAPSVADAATSQPADTASTPTQSPTAIVPRDSNATTPVIPSSNGDSLTLEGHASGPVWFTITTDGNRTETGAMDSGATKVWHAQNTFRVSLGNAGGLALSLNGKAIGTLGPKSSAVRNRIIDSAGIRTAAATTPITTAPRRTTTTSPTRRTPSSARPPVMRKITPTELKRPSIP